MTDLPAAAITAAAEILAAADDGEHIQRYPQRYARAALEAAAPAIRAQAAAAERERIIALASQLRAAIPAGQPPGAQASFADYLRVTTEGDTT